MYYKKETVNADGKEIVSPVYTYLKGCLSAIESPSVMNMLKFAY